MLPRDVQRVIKPSGRVYYYYAPGRGTAIAGKRIPLGSDTADPEFWRKLREAQSHPATREGTLSKLIAEYRAHKEFDDLRPESKRVYAHFLDRLDASGGERPVAAMTRRDLYATRPNEQHASRRKSHADSLAHPARVRCAARIP
jgi:hypothetical protein